MPSFSLLHVILLIPCSSIFSVHKNIYEEILFRLEVALLSKWGYDISFIRMVCELNASLLFPSASVKLKSKTVFDK